MVYWGAAEPLGQSLVLPAVKRLAESGAQLTLVTFEKPSDLLRRDDIKQIRAFLVECGVRWVPLRYHKRPKVPATAVDFLQGCVRGIVARLDERPDVIHARTFVGGLIGLALASVLRAKLIYHNEGFYPDEQVDAGVWKLNSPSHRFAKVLEQRLYTRADGIIGLSSKAKALIELLPAIQRKRTPVIVVPSCVDLDHFQRTPTPAASSDTLRLIYVGSVGGRYGLKSMGRFAAAASQDVKVHLRVLTPQDSKLAKSVLEGSGLPSDAWSVDSVPYRAMPIELAGQQAGLHFLSQGLSDHGGSPTKIGEYWATGLPVVVTPNAGDSEEIIRRERVGVIVEGRSDSDFRRAALELRALLKDGDLADRCRRAAENHYGLEQACERQFKMYCDLVQQTKRAQDNCSQCSNP
jgi:glycosyltransferase involved in cell wall biosynthesis